MIAGFRRVALVCALVASMLVGFGATPASAALPICNTDLRYQLGRTYEWWIPQAWTGKAYTVDCVLREGVRNSSAVKRLQWHLNSCYHQNLKVDGWYGSDTRVAVSNAQTLERVVYHRIVVTDGVYGPQTRRAMHFDGNLGCVRLDGTFR